MMTRKVSRVAGIIPKILSRIALDQLLPWLPIFREINFEIGSRATQSEKLLPSSRWVTTKEMSIEKRLPEREAEQEAYEGIQVHLLENVTVFSNRRFSPLLSGRYCFVPQRKEPGPWDFGLSGSKKVPGSVLFQDGTTIGFAGGHDKKSFKEALYIGTRAPDNYYHWLTNALPSLHLANNSALVPERIPVLVPEIVRTQSQLVEALQIVSKARPIEYFGESELVHVDRLFTVDPPPVYDTPLSEKQEDRIPLFLHEEAISSFRNYILQVVAPRPRHNSVKRLFLLRPKGDLRAVGQDELLSVAEEFGFRGVRTESMSFEEQVELFSAATFLTGPTGAAFTNILFSSQSKSLLYKDSLNENENFFALLASVGKGQVFVIESGKKHESPGRLSPVRYRKALQSLLGTE